MAVLENPGESPIIQQPALNQSIPTIHVPILRLKLIVCLLFAASGATSTVAAQDAFHSHSSTAADSEPSGDATGDSPLPRPYDPALMEPETDPGVIALTGKNLIARSRLQEVVRVDSQLTFDDNIFINGHDQQSDLVFTLSPTLALGIGDVRSEFKRVSLGMFSPAVIDES